MVGIGANQELRCPAVFIQPKHGLDNGGDQPLGKLGDDVHGTGGGVGFGIALALMDDLHDLLVVAVQRFPGIILEKCQCLGGIVIEFLLDSEGNGDVAALVHLAAHNETVHLGPQHKGFADGGTDQVEKGIFVFCSAFIDLFQIGIQGTGINVDVDVRLVVTAVGHQGSHNAVEGRNVLQPDAVFAVAPFSLFHSHDPPVFCNNKNIIAKIF